MQELERQSEQLDESFQSYLRRQKIRKRQINDDVTHIWDSYNLSKAALEQYECVSGQANLMHNQPKLMNTTKIDRALNLELNENDDDSILREFQEIKQIKSPQFDKNEIFPKQTVFGGKKSMKVDGTCSAINSILYRKAQEKLQKEFDELSGLTPTSMSKKWNPTKKAEIEVWKSKVNEDNKISNGRDLQETIDSFYRKRNEESSENKIDKHCEVLEDNTIPFNAASYTQSEIYAQIEQEDLLTKCQSKILTAHPKNLSLKIEPKKSTNTLNVEQKQSDSKIANDSKSSDDDSTNIRKEEYIEPTVIITSKIANINLNGSSTNRTDVFEKLSSNESGEDSSLQISIGPKQPSKSDDFWI